jgi:hypothetical protein
LRIGKVFQYPEFMIDTPYTSSSSINSSILVQLKTNNNKRWQGSSERNNLEGLPARDTRFWRRRGGPHNKVQFFIQESNAKCMILHNIKNW